MGRGFSLRLPAIHEDYKKYLTHMTEGQGYPTTHGEGFTSKETIDFYVEQSYTTRAWFEKLGFAAGRRQQRWRPRQVDAVLPDVPRRGCHRH